jgi:site-specific recombinase XerD
MATIAVTWEGALRSFLLHLSAINRAEKTIRFYKVQLGQLIPWANLEGISLTEFRKSHLDLYLAWRRENGTSRMTMRHDAACAKKFTAWCKKYDYLERDPLIRIRGHEAADAPLSTGIEN